MSRKSLGFIAIFLMVAPIFAQSKSPKIDYNGIVAYSQYSNGGIGIGYKFTNKTGKTITAFSAKLTQVDDFGEKISSYTIKVSSSTLQIHKDEFKKFSAKNSDVFIVYIDSYGKYTVYLEDDFSKSGLSSTDFFAKTINDSMKMKCEITAIAFDDGTTWKK